MTRLRQSSGFLNVAVRRSFATVQNELLRGRVAFILGAGADILIAREFSNGQKNLPPNWTKLICGLEPFLGIISNSKGTQTQIESIAQNWPAEAASLARWWSGDKDFQADIQRGLDQPEIIEAIKRGIPKGTSTYELCRLLIQSNLIITPNYSSYLVHALRSFKAKANIAVIDREDLPSLPFPETERNPATIFVVHLHGRCSARSFPVLDAWGYNIVQHDDYNYVELLRRLFTDRSVVTIGVSWSDPPLRSSAAFVQRTRPYLSKRHLAFYFVPTKDERKMFGNVARNPDSGGIARLWSGAMRAAYGVDILFVNENTQLNMLKQLSNEKSAKDHTEKAICGFRQRLYDSEHEPEKLVEVWEQIAEFLDSCGDYESPLQHHFLRMLSGIGFPTSHAVAEATHDLAEKLLVFIERAALKTEKELEVKQWSIAARVERHLRHHLYLYRPRRPSKIREVLWQRLWKRLPISEWNKVPNQLKFDFLLGKFELKLPNIDLNKLQHNLGLLESRFSKASRIWSHAPGPLSRRLAKDSIGQRLSATAMEKLAVELLDLGWESLSAKVLCDQMHFLATIASTNDITANDPLAKIIVDKATHAGRVSRSAGCFRRQVKADSIAAMWTPDPLEGRVQLLGNIRASEETKSVEPGLLGGLGAGLLVCDLRARSRAGQSIKNLRTFANDLFDEAGLDRSYVYDALKYWIPFTPKQVSVQMLALAKELEVQFTNSPKI